MLEQLKLFTKKLVTFRQRLLPFSTEDSLLGVATVVAAESSKSL